MAAVITRTFATPNPEELSFGVLVAHDRVLEYKLKPVGTAYKYYGDMVKPAPRMADGYGEYLFTGTQDSEEGLWLLFGKPKTLAQALTPFRRYVKKFGNHYWHGILVDVVVVADAGRVIATPGPNGTTRFEYPHVARKVFIPPVSEGTEFILEEFLSPTPFKFPRARVPQPGSVHADFGDVEVDVPECLHGRLEIGPQQTVFAIDNADKEASRAFSAIQGQNYPATNVITRRKYTLMTNWEQVGGVYHGIRMKVRPPRLDEDDLTIE